MSRTHSDIFEGTPELGQSDNEDDGSDLDFALPEGFELPMQRNADGNLVPVGWSSIMTVDGTRRVSVASSEGQTAVRENNRRLTETALELHDAAIVATRALTSMQGPEQLVTEPSVPQMVDHGHYITLGSPILAESTRGASSEPQAGPASLAEHLTGLQTPQRSKGIEQEGQQSEPPLVQHGTGIVSPDEPAMIEESIERSPTKQLTQPPLSPAWSSDSDNRLTKALTAGKTITMIRNDFPEKTLRDLGKRRKHLTDQGIFGIEQLTPHAPSGDDFDDPVAMPKRSRGWSPTEDDVVVAGVRAEETQAQISGRLNGRSAQAVKNRLYRLVETGRITEGERQKVMNAAYGPSYTVGSKWTPAEDAILIRAIHDGKTAVETVSLLTNRTEGSVTRRRGILVDLGQVDATEVFATPPGIIAKARSPAFKRARTTNKWSTPEDALLRKLVLQSLDWKVIFSRFPTRTDSSVRNRWSKLAADTNGGSPALDDAPAGAVAVVRQQSVPTKAGATWTEAEDQKLIECYEHGMSWASMEGLFGARKAGAFANRWTVLLRKGKVTAVQDDSSSAFSGSENGKTLAVPAVSSKLAGRHSLPPPLETRSQKRKALLKPPDDGNRSTEGPSSITSKVKATVRKSAPSLKRPIPAEIDTTTDEEMGLIEIGAKQPLAKRYKEIPVPRPSVRSRGLISTRGISRPPAYRRQQATRPPASEASRPSTANSIDVLSGPGAFSFSGRFDDTPMSTEPSGREQTVGPKPVPAPMRMEIGARTSLIRTPRVAAASISPVVDEGRLDEALAAQDTELESLKTRLAKFEKLARQQKEIAELNRRLEQYQTEGVVEDVTV